VKHSIEVVVFVLMISVKAYSLSINYQVSFNVTDFRFIQENGYDVVQHAGCMWYGEIGAPQVLSTSLQFIIPADMTVNSITVTTDDNRKFREI